MAAKELIETITVGSGGAAAIEFTSIPQDGTDLLLVLSGRAAAGGSYLDFYVRFNSNSSNIYTSRMLTGTGSAVSSRAATSTEGIADLGVVGDGATASTFCSSSMYVPNYANGANKTFSVDTVTENNATQAGQTLTAGIWANTAAITTIRIYTGANLVQHSSASLYKFTKGSGGATVS